MSGLISLFILCSIGLIVANVKIDTKAVTAMNYDHSIGGGSWDSTTDILDGYYYSGGDITCFLIKITTTEDFSYSSSAVLRISYIAHDALDFKGAWNNCPDDTACSDKSGGASVEVAGDQIQISHLGPSMTMIVRLDFVIGCEDLSMGSALEITKVSYDDGNDYGDYQTSSIDIGDSNWIDFVHSGSVLCCDDNNLCTDDSSWGPYDGLSCWNQPKDCDDYDACTHDSCDSNSGDCTHTPISCDDYIDCTKDECDSNHGCKHTLLDCCDDNACTFDNCDPLSGCVYTPIDCDDNNACTQNSCNPAVGCIVAAICCCDGDECTEDSCDYETGCIHTEMDCNDNNLCTDDSCNPETGCVHHDICCDDSDPCTEEWCSAQLGCQYYPIPFDDFNECTEDSCVQYSGPVHTPKDCNDNDACTEDSCSPDYGCTYTFVD